MQNCTLPIDYGCFMAWSCPANFKLIFRPRSSLVAAQGSYPHRIEVDVPINNQGSVFRLMEDRFEAPLH